MSRTYERFVNFPARLESPDRAAQRIAALDTIAEREAFWLQVPEAWRPMIGHFAELAIAARIVDMPEKIERQNAIASVPEIWRENVKWHVLRLWGTREIREAYRQELAAARREAIAKGTW